MATIVDKQAVVGLGKRTHLQQKSYSQDENSEETTLSQSTPSRGVRHLQPKSHQGSILSFCVDKTTGEKFKVPQKPTKHPLSLWRDQTLQPRALETDKEGDIFSIIMPWVPDKEKEDRENQQCAGTLSQSDQPAAKATKKDGRV